MTRVRVTLPAHLRSLAGTGPEVVVDVVGAPTIGALLDALEAAHPALGLIVYTWHLWNTDYETELPAVADRVVGVHVADYREETRGWLDRVLPGDGVGQGRVAGGASGQPGPQSLEVHHLPMAGVFVAH